MYAGQALSDKIAKIGGSSSVTWSIEPGGVNASWLSIDPATGVLSGTPTPAQAGCVSVTVRVQDPSSVSNYAEQTFTFNVDPDIYYTSFEGTCPDGWTLNGDWKCGVPSKVGPATAYDGTQCIGTGMGQNYSNGDTWLGTTATSPQIDLTGASNPSVTFRLWVYTEGGSNTDGANLEISTDGSNYDVLQVTPAYQETNVNLEPAWGGNQAALGWQLVSADLTPYSGSKVYLRFAFRSNNTNTFPGVYVDDFLVQ